MITSK